MPQQDIECSGAVPASADLIWSLVGNFHGTWHPAIATMAVEKDDHDRLLRAFTVNGEDTVYRERLTWYSDSERSLAYTHVEGIEGVQQYNARLQVDAAYNDSCIVTMTAQLAASEPRATQIAAGTKAIFDDAIEAIKIYAASVSDKNATLAGAPPVNNSKGDKARTGYSSGNTLIGKKIIDGTPALTVSCIQTSVTSDTLCLFLHGIGGNRSNWDQQLLAISEYCTSAALDLRGYGDSESGDNQSTVDDYCADIIRVVDTFGAKRLILCGLSYGAWIATSFAVRHKDRLAGLVLSGGCTGMSEADNKEREAFRRSREAPLNEGKTPADFAADVLKVLAGPAITEKVKQELLRSMQSIPSSTYADALRCFTNPTEQFDFSSITVPVLLMTGEADKLAPPSEIMQVAERIHQASPAPDVRFECLKNAGHVCNLEAPEDYNAALANLVQRLLS